MNDNEQDLHDLFAVLAIFAYVQARKMLEERKVKS